MARIVELSGPPGVGKTTIYKEIEKQWHKKCSWIPAHFLYPHLKLNYQSLITLLKNLYKTLKDEPNKIGSIVFSEARKRFVTQYPEYIDRCWNDILAKQKTSLNGRDLRFEKVQQLSEMIEKIQLLKESETEKIAILDEGLIHLLDVLSFCNSRHEIVEIINVMPLPDALIYIQTEVSENVERLVQREEVISIHKYLNTGQLQKITSQSRQRRIIINEILKDKGIPILEIDLKTPARINAAKIISFMNFL